MSAVSILDREGKVLRVVEAWEFKGIDAAKYSSIGPVPASVVSALGLWRGKWTVVVRRALNALEVEMDGRRATLRDRLRGSGRIGHRLPVGARVKQPKGGLSDNG